MELRFLMVTLIALGSPETSVICVTTKSFGDRLVTSEGIYFIHWSYPKAKPLFGGSIDYYDFTTGRTRIVAPLPHDPPSNPGLSLSPDGKWLIYSIDDHRNMDVMLVENFHWLSQRF